MHNDTMSEAGAHCLAVKIRAWWRQRGYAVTVRVERLVVATARSAKGEGIWTVRSDLGMGLPEQRLGLAD